MSLAAVPPSRTDEGGVAARGGSLGKITTRPSVADDSAFMLELYASTSQDQLDDLGWSIGSQRTFVIMQAQTEEWNRARQYPGMDRLTICVDDLPVGRLLVCLRNNILHLVDLSLLPRCRGLGIGTQLMSEIMEEAGNARVPVKVKVLKETSGVRFVERLGFGSPTDLGRWVEYTWMPPLASLGPDARDEGFAGKGTRAHRTAQRGDQQTQQSPGFPEAAEDAPLPTDTLTAADPTVNSPVDPIPDAPVAAVDSLAAEVPATLEAVEPPAAAETSVADAVANAVVSDPTGDAGPDLDEEFDAAAESDDPDTSYEETIAATDAFTANFTSSFSAELAEDGTDDFDEVDDRYDPFA